MVELFGGVRGEIELGRFVAREGCGCFGAVLNELIRRWNIGVVGEKEADLKMERRGPGSR